MRADAQNSLTVAVETRQAGKVPGRPYRSTLIPHFQWIKARRRAGATWQEIAAALNKEKGIKIGAAAVYRFYDRTAKRTQWPAGMEPDNKGLVAELSSTPSADAPKASLFGTSRSRNRPLLATAAPAAPEAGKPRPYRSQLLPFLAFIAEQRRAGESWRQIAVALKTRKGISISYQAVAQFYKRTHARQQRAAAKAGDTSTAPSAGTSPAPDSFSDDDPITKYLS